MHCFVCKKVIEAEKLDLCQEKNYRCSNCGTPISIAVLRRTAPKPVAVLEGEVAVAAQEK